MNNDDKPWFLHGRRFSVDVLIAAATFAAANAAMGSMADILYPLLIPLALISLALMLEPRPAGRAAGESSTRPLQFASESKPDWSQPIGRFNAPVVDGASV